MDNGQSQTPLVNAFTRVWLQKGRARPDHRPVYKGFHRIAGLNQNFGSINPIFAPSKRKFGKFDQVGSYRDAEERPTTSLIGHYAADMKSEILTLAKAACPADLQVHIGKCEDPSVFNSFQKILIFEDVYVETISSDDLGALEPGDQGKVDETGDISAARMYEYMPMSYAARNPSVVTNELLDGIVDRAQSCGDCERENTGSQNIYAISGAAGGSPGTPADVVFSLDKGQNWSAHDIDSLGSTEAPNGIAIMGQYLVVVSADSVSLHMALLSEFLSGDPSWAEVTTGFVAAGGPRAIWSVGNKAYIVGNNGYIYECTSPGSGVTVVDAGVATTSHLLTVHTLNEDFAVAAGEDGVIVSISGGLANLITTTPVGLGVDILSIQAKSQQEWFIGTTDGKFWSTLDGGATWTPKTSELSGTKTAVRSIRIVTDSVMYVAGDVGGHGAIWSSVDGGFSFEREKRGTGLIPLCDKINALAVCGEDDPDFLVGVGLHDNGSDGFIVVGSD